jgi:hypothetical protein
MGESEIQPKLTYREVHHQEQSGPSSQKEVVNIADKDPIDLVTPKSR